MPNVPNFGACMIWLGKEHYQAHKLVFYRIMIVVKSKAGFDMYRWTALPVGNEI